MHRGWFAEETWSLDAEVVSLVESPEIGVAVLRLDYRDDAPDRAPVRCTEPSCHQDHTSSVT